MTMLDGERLRVDRGVCNDAEPDDGCTSRTIEFKSGEGALKSDVFSLIYFAHEQQTCGGAPRLTDVTFSIRAKRND